MLRVLHTHCAAPLCLLGPLKEMEKNKASEEEIEKEKEDDRKLLGVWKEVAITGIRQMLPPKMQPLLRFNNWEEAMRLLNNRDKKE